MYAMTWLGSCRAGGAVLLYDPRRLAAPAARMDAGAPNPGRKLYHAAVRALHWQHTAAEMEARRAAPAATPMAAADASATPMLGLPLVRAGAADHFSDVGVKEHSCWLHLLVWYKDWGLQAIVAPLHKHSALTRDTPAP